MNFKLILSELRISLNNSLFVTRMVAVLSVLNLLIFGLLTVKSVMDLVEKYRLYRQFTINTETLNDKLSYLEKNATYEATYDGYINSLVYAIPKSVELQEYLTILNSGAGKAGFILKSFRPSIDGKNKISFNADFRGSAENIPELIKSLEKLPRLTLIELVKATREKNLFRVEISGKLVYLGD